MNTAALLGNLLNTQADYNYVMQQQIYWNAKYEANQTKLTKQVNFEEKWESAYDDCLNGNKECKFGGTTYCAEGSPATMAKAKAYADKKVAQYDQQLSEELSALDVEYDSMKTMYDTYLETLKAQKDAEKTTVQTAAQDTGLLAQ